MDLWIIENIAPLFYAVMELSLAAVCIGLGVLLLRKTADKRIPPYWKNALWLLVLVALVVPYRPSSNVAVIPSTALKFRQQETTLTTEITQEKNEVDSVYQVPTELTQQREALHTKSLIFEVAIPAIWLLGVAVMMGVLLATRQKMVLRISSLHPTCHPERSEGSSSVTPTNSDSEEKILRRSAPQNDTVSTLQQQLLQDCKRQLNITQPVQIVEQSYLKSPALWGLFHPKILLPDYVSEMSEDSQKYILLHELCHLKHHDLWKSALLLALQVVYWFNPLVWVLFRFIRQDMELLNDERVLKTLEKSEETPYAMSLIEVLGHSNKLPLAPQMLCMVDNKGNTKRRIQMIQLGEVFKKHKIIIAVGCLAMMAVLSALFLTAQPEAPDPGSTGNSKPVIPLSLDDVITLSAKGEDLTWADFEQFSYTEVGSGLYIRVYEINDLFGFSIGGGSTEDKPFYMTLGAKIEGEPSIDIRTENVTEFIDKYSMGEDESDSTLTVTDATSSGVPLALSTDDSEMIQQLLDITEESDDWNSGALEITPDIQITSAEGDILMYESKSGTLVNTTQNQSVILDYEAKIGFNEVLGRYVTLEGTSSELVGDPQPLTADELSYFNDTYFNGATGQNLNLANQFLHNPFDLPINIDLSMLFYHGAGADYAMSEDGEYDAVARAYGFDGWADIPTDVTPIPKASMDDMLERYTGIDLFATKKIGLDSFKYLEEYDCYYNLHGDTNYYGTVEFVSGTQAGDRVALSYYNSWQQADYVLTLVDYGGENYKIYSNLPA